MVLTTARDSRVLALFITTPAHPHATSVAVYPALFFMTLILTPWMSIFLTGGWTVPRRSHQQNWRLQLHRIYSHPQTWNKRQRRMKKKAYTLRHEMNRNFVKLMGDGKWQVDNNSTRKNGITCLDLFCQTECLNHRKFMSVWKLCKKSFKRHVAGHSSIIRLEMALEWVKTLPHSILCLFE